MGVLWGYFDSAVSTLAFRNLRSEDRSENAGTQRSREEIAFVVDKVNDVPVVALVDAEIAMSGLGSDTTIDS